MKNILAVVVLYKCRPEMSAACRTLNTSLQQEGCRMDVLIYDNSPSPTCTESRFAMGNLDVVYISDVRNPGVSTAYNEGWTLARSMGKSWLLLSDQDTTYPEEAIGAYAAQTQAEHSLCAPVLSSEVGIVSPCRFRWGYGWPLKRASEGELSLRGRSVLNSGLLIGLEVFEKAGGFDEGIPLDFSDHEWIGRVRQFYPSVYVMDLICRQQLSATETDERKVLVRFGFYLTGARGYRRSNASAVLGLVVLLRTLRLSVRFRTFGFLRCYFNSYLH